MREKITLAVPGVGGRLGSEILKLAFQDETFEVAVALEKKGHSIVGQTIGSIQVTDNPKEIEGVDVLIEFTTPEATIEHLPYIKRAAIIGTTGLKEEQMEQVVLAAKEKTILYSTNMAIGPNYLLKLIPEIIRDLGPEYDIGALELHRKGKKDAPSGTAKKSSKLVQEKTGRELYFHSLRLGDIPGTHIWFIAGRGEVITITHQAESAVLFAQAALVLAKRLVTQAPGRLYEPSDLL